MPSGRHLIRRCEYGSRWRRWADLPPNRDGIWASIGFQAHRNLHQFQWVQPGLLLIDRMT